MRSRVRVVTGAAAAALLSLLVTTGPLAGCSEGTAEEGSRYGGITYGSSWYPDAGPLPDSWVGSGSDSGIGSGSDSGIGSGSDSGIGSGSDGGIGSGSDGGIGSGSDGGIGTTDHDQDSIPDSIDNCPMDANADQSDLDGDGLGDACDTCNAGSLQIDSDGDRVEDLCDLCPTIADNQGDADADGIGDACDAGDSDGDGLADQVDNCPGVANPNQADADADGKGDACDDSDGDGVNDQSDNCRLFRNPSQADEDGDGIGDACESGDADNDGVADGEDNCPTVANPGQADSDSDQVGDACQTQPPPDTDGDGVTDPADNCPFVSNHDQADVDNDGRGDACDLPPCDTPAALMSMACNAPACDGTWRAYSQEVSLQSASHHAPEGQHIYNPPPGWTVDRFERCSGDKCAGYRNHGHSATVHWEAKCALVEDQCVARVRIPDPYATAQTNWGGSNYHFHWLEPEHGCAFIDNGNGPRKTNDCKVGGSEKVEAVPDMTTWGDGVVYGTGYAANHDSSSAPSIGISVGYRGAGAFVIINNSTAATYSKAMAWAQGMACNDQGIPYKLTNNGAGRDYPWASSGEGSE